MFVIYFLNIIILMLLVFVGVMYITLLERKILSYSQMRVGPNKVSFQGIMQPIIDGLKLFLKSFVFLGKSNFLIFYLGPMIVFLICFLLWFFIPQKFFFNSGLVFSSLLFYCIIGMSVYSTLISGWGSNSKYSTLGGIRSMAQTISYEISLAFLLFSVLIVFESLNLNIFLKYNFVLLFFFLMPVIFLLFLSFLAESNRAPFDFLEGESELVSGFNVEYGSSSFALLFIGEYGIVLFFSVFLSCFFGFFTYFLVFLFVSFFLLFRSSYPRYRYDLFMYFLWKKILPTSIFLCFIFLIF